MGTDVEKQIAPAAYGQHFRINLPYGCQKKIDYNHLTKKKKGRKFWIWLLLRKIPIVSENVYVAKWVCGVRTSVKNWLYFEVLVPEMPCRGRSISTRAHRNNSVVAKPSSKKSWQRPLITKHLAANAGCVSGCWVQPELPELPEPPADYLKPLAAWTNWTRCLGVMWQRQVLSLLPLGGKRRLALVTAGRRLEFFPPARGRSLGLVFEMDGTHIMLRRDCEVLPCACLRENVWSGDGEARIPTDQHQCRAAEMRQFRFKWPHSPSSRDVFLPSLSPCAIDIQNVSKCLAALTDWDLIFSRRPYSTLNKKQWRSRFTAELWNFFGVQILGIPGFVC